MEVLAKLIEEYPYRKSQIQIIHHETNQGLACSRIDGIKSARGKYIAHCDSDDWIDVDLYEKLYNKAEETDADLTICDFVCEYTLRRTSKKIVTNFNCTPRQALRNMHNESFYCMVWRCLFRREFVLKYNILPLPHVDMWEDTCVTLPAFYYANQIAKVNDSVYHYLINDQSMCANSARPKLYADRKKTIEYLESFFSDKKDFDAKLLISFWKMLAKSYMLTSSDFDPIRWQNEYDEAHKYILRIHAIPFKLRYLYKITSITTYPIRLMMRLKK
jgi:glycosyltransferase